MATARVDFPEALSDALELFCARSTSLNQESKKEKALLKKSLRNRVNKIVADLGKDLPAKLPAPNKIPLVPKSMQKARA